MEGKGKGREGGVDGIARMGKMKDSGRLRKGREGAKYERIKYKGRWQEGEGKMEHGDM